ncbi:MAG: hypothetical protein KGI70_02685 [Patescibacteria group bacterium]|nr:hypothetical protein [Patescibacteria group bacterium]
MLAKTTLITRRTLILGAGVLAFTSGAAHSEWPSGFVVPPSEEVADFKDLPRGKAPGDFNFDHAEHHADYQTVFGSHCGCGDGECRVTVWRKTTLGSPKGFDVVVERRWWPLPANVWMPDPENVEVPLGLRLDRAHVCAYSTDGYTMYPYPLIRCAIINEWKA